MSRHSGRRDDSETREAALAHAVDAIETMLASMIKHDEPVTLPTAVTGAGESEAFVDLSLPTSLKTLLHAELRLSGVPRAELARRLGWQRGRVDRLLRLGYPSRLDQIEAAFRAIGREITVETRVAA